MIELVLTVCAMAATGSCEEKRLIFEAQETLVECALQAPPYIAAWAEDHPGRRIARWRCTFPGSDGVEI